MHKYGVIHINIISMELSFLHFKGFLVKISLKWCISVHEDCFLFLSKQWRLFPNVSVISSIQNKKVKHLQKCKGFTS